jgi:hypothetical protein
LKISLPKHDPFYIGDYIVPGQDTDVVWSPNPLATLTYTAPVCETATESSSESAIESFLGGKIASVTDIYSMELTRCGSLGHCRHKQDFVAALSSCQVTALQPNIAQAIQSLKAMPECGCPE